MVSAERCRERGGTGIRHDPGGLRGPDQRMKRREKERKFRIGRARDCDIVLADESVSRYHAELSYIEDGKLLLTDRHSVNGTALVSNGRETSVHRTLVSPTESVRFGDVVLTVKELLEAIRLKFPAFYSVPESGARDARSEARKPSSRPWVSGDRLVRCSCGAPKAADEPCPVCGL